MRFYAWILNNNNNNGNAQAHGAAVNDKNVHLPVYI